MPAADVISNLDAGMGANAPPPVAWQPGQGTLPPINLPKIGVPNADPTRSYAPSGGGTGIYVVPSQGGPAPEPSMPSDVIGVDSSVEPSTPALDAVMARLRAAKPAAPVEEPVVQPTAKAAPTPALAPADQRYTSGVSDLIDTLDRASKAAIPPPEDKRFPVKPGQTSGTVANIGAGTTEAVTGTLGMPVDLTTSVLNLAGSALGLPPITNPIGGSHSLNQLFSFVGANPENVAPADQGERLARAAGMGATSVMLPGGVARRVLQAAIPERIAPPIMELTGGAKPVTAVNPVLKSLSHGAGVAGGTAGAVGGDLGEMASELTDDERYKPLLNMLGNFGGGFGVSAGRMAAELTARMGSNAARRVVTPLGIGRKITPINPQTNAPFTNNVTGETIRLTRGQARLLGQQQASALGQSPAEGAASIPTEPAPGQIGTPTIGQTSGNLRQLAYERALRTKARTAFNKADSDQNALRARALAGLAPPDVSEMAARDFVLQRLRDVDAATPEEMAREAAARASVEALPQTPASATGAQMGTQIAQAQAPAIAASEEQLAAATKAMEEAERSVGGGPGTRLDDVGRTIQTALQKIDEFHQKNVDRLADLIDPEGTLVVDNTPVISRARSVLRSEANRPNRKAPEGETAEILKLAATQDAASPFQDLRDLRTRITTELRVQRELPDGRLNVARLSQLLSAVDESFAAAAGKGAAEDSAAIQAGTKTLEQGIGARLAGEGAEHPAPPASMPDKIYTPTGREIGVKYKLVEGDSLVTSHDNDLNPNPAFPPELQPRQRDRAASELQVHNIGARLRPESVGPSPSPMEGAPVVGPDNVVEAGNGRTLGILRALSTDNPLRQAYLDYLQRQGFDPAGFKNPVLVRERTTPLSADERVRFVQEANADPQLAMSAPETAKQDAGRLSDSTLGLWKGGDIKSDRNIPFVRAFVQNVVDKGQEGQLVTQAGTLSEQGAQRIENALLHKAYGSPELVRTLVEEGDENVRAFGRALREAAPEMARLADDAAAGRADPALAIGDHLAEAAKIIADARRLRVSISDVVNQHDMLGGGVSPLADQVIRWAYGPELRGRMNVGRIADGLRFYANEARQQSGLFGQPETAEQLLARAEAKYGGQTIRAQSSAEGAGASSGAAGDVEGNGKGGAEARRPGAGENSAQGAGNGPDGAAGQTQGVGVLPPKALPTPNITPENVEAYAAMRAAHEERMRLMHEKAVGDVLKPGATKGSLAMEAERVAPRLFNAGGTPTADVRSFVNAVGGATDAEAAEAFRKLAIDPETGEVSPERMAQLMAARRQAIAGVERYAGFSLREAATKDGQIDPRLAKNWLDDHAAALDAFPDVRAKFQTLTQLGERLKDRKAERAALDKDYPLAGLGTNADITAKYVQPGPRGAERIQQYVRDTNGSPEAMRILDDGLLSSLRDAAFRSGDWSAPAYERWMRDYASALRERPDLARRLNSLGDAQNEVAAAQARRVENVKALQDSAAGHYLTKTGEPVDPQAAVASLFRSKTSPDDAAELVKLMGTDPVALAGLRRNVADWLIGRVRSTRLSGTSEEMKLKSSALVRDMQDAKMRRTLNAIFTSDQVDVLDGVVDSMLKEGTSLDATSMPGASNTTADTHALGHEPANILMQGLAAEALVEFGLEMAHTGQGAGGLMLRAAAGVTAAIYAHMRAVGFKKFDDLAAQGVIQPELGRIFLQHAVSDPQSPLLQRLYQRMGALLTASAAMNQDKHRK